MTRSSEESPFKQMPLGAPPESARVFTAPGVVMWLAGATIFFFVLILVSPGRMTQILETVAAVSPNRFLAGPSANGGVLAMISPLFSHMFVHADLMHLTFNLLWLLAFGAPVARRMGVDSAASASGRFASSSVFLTFYFLAGAAGALSYIFLHSQETILLVGASGGVSGLLGGLVRFGLGRPSFFGSENAPIAPLLSRSVLVWSFFVIALNLIVGIAPAPFLGGQANIAWEAHIGGYLFGLITMPFFLRITQSYR